MTTIFIVGTHHKHQFGLCNCFDRNDQACEAFANYLKCQCIVFDIKTLVEEMCCDARIKWGISLTVPESVALDLKIDHADCDLNEEERRLLGIVNEGIIRTNGIFHKYTEKTIQKNIRREYDKKEFEWIHRISQLPNYPALFICGSEHSSSFMVKANKQGFRSHMIIEEWTPDQSNM